MAWVGLGSVLGWLRVGLGWFRVGLGLAWAWFRVGLGLLSAGRGRLGLTWFRVDVGLVWVWFSCRNLKAGLGLVEGLRFVGLWLV